MERKCPMRNGGAKITNTGRQGKLPMIGLNNMKWKIFYLESIDGLTLEEWRQNCYR